MSILNRLEVIVRYDAYPANVTPLGGQPDATCDIIDENGEPIFYVDAESAPHERVSVEFGSHDVAVLLVRDHGAGLIVMRVQVADTMAAHSEATDGVS